MTPAPALPSSPTHSLAYNLQEMMDGREQEQEQEQEQGQEQEEEKQDEAEKRRRQIDHQIREQEEVDWSISDRVAKPDSYLVEAASRARA